MSKSKKLTLSASMTALSVVAIAIGRFFPLLSVTPLILCAICFYICFECDLKYGILSIVASLTLGFFIVGFSGAFILSATFFAPYSVLAYAIKKLDYSTKKGILIRAISVAILTTICLVAIWFIGIKIVFPDTLESLISKHNLLIPMAIVAVAFMIGFDYIFIQIIKIILSKYLKINSKGDSDDKRI